ncbi:MAG: GIY-YIG nuclease family protein [Candidatus Omnitrophica bacterium]|nr:GIY-YIG nuclease family protein [Candidatus Omnitrophota bacterium]
MLYIYVLRSLKNKKRYVGSTKILPEERIKQHNYGSNNWTKHNRPFELIYKETCSTVTEARKREHFLKSGAGRKFLDETLKRGAVSSAG